MPAFDSGFDLGFDAGIGSGILLGGFDPFDSLLNKVCSILTNQNSELDSYGQRQQNPEDFSSLADNVRCRVSDKALGRPHELKVGKKLSEAYSTIFLRPPQLSDGSKLNPHHWILLTGTVDSLTGAITPLPPGEEIYYNIFDVLNPGRLDHHLELIAQRVIP